MQIKTSHIRKILIIQLRAIGDVVLTTAVLPVLRNHFPHAEIHFLTGYGVDKLIRGLEYLDEVFVYDRSQKNIVGIFKYINKIRRKDYDLVIDYQGTPGTAYLTKFSGATYRLGWEIKRRLWAYNLYSDAHRNEDYVAVQKCQALSELGIRETQSETFVNISESNIKTVHNYFTELSINRSRLLVNITPKGKRQTRQWYPEKIAALADLLIEKHETKVFYNWAPGELDYVKNVATLSRNKVHILPGWPLEIFAAYLSQVDLHFSYDNGPKHIAIATGTPTLCLFATDSPVLWNPLNDQNHPYLLADVPCRFCGLRQCDLMICMKQIEPEDVMNKIESMPAIEHKLLNGQHLEW